MAAEEAHLRPSLTGDCLMSVSEHFGQYERLVRRYQTALLDAADRGLTSDNEDVRLWTREWVEHYRIEIEGARRDAE